MKILGVSGDKIHIARHQAIVDQVPDDLKNHHQEKRDDGKTVIYFADDGEKERAQTTAGKSFKSSDIQPITITPDEEDFISRLAGRVASRTEAEKYLNLNKIPLTLDELQVKLELFEQRITAIESQIKKGGK